ncbi:Lsr2 family protein [Streptomyces sp. ISL-36]|uniref:Lsr2 family DNA-binding protein n=1 Tax=Streptomyces sp. ISL-36 TaxID=2819182 RepID=UPI001BE50461|nr:SMI1/KNR4 family protein [Streptomyces sp. ISL-36]MBT2445150.1 Lsr2 family protein [Streptomyces sp. ISL-36]
MTAWFEQHAPHVFAALGGPGNSTTISEAETRMGLELPWEMRQWLLANDIDADRQPDVRSCLVALRCQGVIPSGGLLLGLTDIERVYLHKTAMEEMEPSEDPEHPSWRREWVPISAERDGLYGKFLNTRTGSVGSWTEGSSPSEGQYTSLFAFFHDVADQLEGVSPGKAGETAWRRRPGRTPKDEATRLWARANGYLINDHGRIPGPIREAYEASL